MPSNYTQDPVMVRAKHRGSLLSLVTNASLTLLKTIAAVMTGSVSLISESIHSGTDVIASLIAFLSVRAASIPPDEEHPYGHGKIESLASFGESILLLLIVAFIFKESGERLSDGSQVKNLQIGFLIMGLSSVTSLIVGIVVRNIASMTQSAAMRSNGRHLLIDFWTSVGVFVALAVTKLTGWQQADAWFAMALAIWIAFNAVSMGRESVEQLIDRRVSDDEIAKLHEVLNGMSGMLSYHRLRTRHSGNVHYIDLHVVVPNDWTVVQGHTLADEIETALESALNPAYAVVHIDPYDANKAHSLPGK